LGVNRRVPYSRGNLFSGRLRDSSSGYLLFRRKSRIHHEKGDAILELNRERIEDLRSLAAIARQAGSSLLLRVRRGDRLLLLVAH
jgi:hypothetical protein